MKKGLVHALAVCADCAWQEDNYLQAQEKGRLHHKRTGHEVNVETGYAQIYERVTATLEEQK